ncbi:MAG: hypothetical protein PHW60_01085 [Kiritimatiellae bacterium]|nr:hypothetical protein [Kiritimatiellia bacterium]
MVAKVKAVTFLKALKWGRTCPCLMLCEGDNGTQVETVVKLYAGKESSRTGLICELLASLVARDLDINIPTPFLIDVAADFHNGITDPELAERFRNSPGLNFGTQHLGAGYTTWPQERSIPSSLLQDASEIFAFDLLIQNPDRRKDKPNLLRKGDELVIFDHEMAFSFLYNLMPDEYPWDGKGIGFTKNHIFYDGLKGRDLSWDRMLGALEAIDDRRLGMYVDALPDDWRKDSGNTAKRIQEYLKQARNNRKMLFQKITEVLI